MPLFMAQFANTPEAWAALIHAPQDRAAASDALVRHLGGRLVGLYYTPGAEYDGFAPRRAPTGGHRAKHSAQAHRLAASGAGAGACSAGACVPRPLLAEAGHLNERGRAFNPRSIWWRAMVGGRRLREWSPPNQIATCLVHGRGPWMIGCAGVRCRKGGAPLYPRAVNQ
jgi:hypothetical protein